MRSRNCSGLSVIPTAVWLCVNRRKEFNVTCLNRLLAEIVYSSGYCLKYILGSVWRMGLKDKQEREIVHVLMDCCLQEKTFNAYYAVLGEKFCTHDRRFQVKYQTENYSESDTCSVAISLLDTHQMEKRINNRPPKSIIFMSPLFCFVFRVAILS